MASAFDCGFALPKRVSAAFIVIPVRPWSLDPVRKAHFFLGPPSIHLGVSFFH